ncbi:hypothetical protein PYW07_004315 [Mythimna separata]|uniref:Uncharacterized protein n=1 Tax=Mythimna separata TaxID=271217 RepID=A0AAD7YX11_MYTSE|nr:hypothetical protein PYW07_004315 [Mythimna separata]
MFTNYRYIYWITDNEIERARLDGSEREVLIKSWVWVRLSLAIDQHAQKIYWIDIPYSDKEIFMKSANLDGKNRTTLHILRNTSDFLAHTLAVTKDFIYWLDEERMEIWTLQKNKTESRLYSNISSVCSLCHRIAANYTIEEEIQGPKSCSPQGMITNNSEECTGSICQNHCLEGDCSVNAERPPKVAVVLGNGVKSTFASTIVNVCLFFYTYFIHFVMSL